YAMEGLRDDLKRIFPDKQCSAVVFGQPTPAVDIGKTNEYVKRNVAKDEYPLLVCGGGSVGADDIYEQVTQDEFYGYKVFLNWVGNDYGEVSVEDMLLPNEMDIANELGLIVLLHVPRALRLADPQIGAGVRKLAKSYPKAKIVLAHCGRCYNPYLMRQAVGSVADLDNVYMDTSMVMDGVTIAMALREMGSERLLFATDLPVAAMLGRRVNAKDHWVDLVKEQYAKSDFRVQSNGFNATFMAHEIAVAVELGADIAGLSEAQMKGIFYDNGMGLLKSVKK
ncbi:MAG: amidohydrolase family protein, partial [Clostridia bacterium]|nr:amidohydrolase family protein [Clostridia bacterium]